MNILAFSIFTIFGEHYQINVYIVCFGLVYGFYSLVVLCGQLIKIDKILHK